ncbi:hemoglobin subunit zeta-like [Protopterus annectens]|uniref:hemoglobin subunit zeta-like n=1 Tax=Protopterus annectens TaxID=7888 RepID=UPI001CF9421B|nr:hemoglobin subunit zeta-like [Protopterus annectens]
MILTAAERSCLASTYEKIASHAEQYGSELFQRMFLGFPQTRTYFAHVDTSANSPQLSAHGAKIIASLGKAIKNVDNMSAALSDLSDLHAQSIRVDPSNFKYISHCLLVLLAAHLQADFTSQVQISWDKLLAAVATVLTEKYR